MFCRSGQTAEPAAQPQVRAAAAPESERRRRMAPPIAPKPTIIIIQVAGSGTGG